MTTETKTTYTMVASGPAVPAAEVERAEQAIEVVVMWGEQALHVAHLAPPRPFYIGESGPNGTQPDWLCGAETVGQKSLPLVLAGAAGPEVVVPEGAELFVTVDGVTKDHASLEEAGLLTASAELGGGARSYALPSSATAHVEYRGFTFVVRPTAAGKTVGMGLSELIASWDRSQLKYIGGALAFFATMLAFTYFLPPSPSGLAIEDINAESRLADYLVNANEVMDEEDPTWLEQEVGDEGGDGQRAADDEGEMGDEESPETNNRSALAGPEDAEPVMANRQAQQEAASTVGALGVLAALSGTWNTPTSPFGADQAVGNDYANYLGAIMGDQIGNNHGFNGLGMTGTGRGGGGDGRGTYGSGNLGTIGQGAGCENPPCGQGYGRNVGLGNGDRESRVPRVRPGGQVDTAGALSAETIRRVVNRHKNEVRHCYESELVSRPDLEGRVTVRFIISGSGAVQGSVVDQGRTNIGSADVGSCVANAVRRWPFPQPENGGVVSVTYPFMFSTH